MGNVQASGPAAPPPPPSPVSPLTPPPAPEKKEDDNPGPMEDLHKKCKGECCVFVPAVAPFIVFLKLLGGGQHTLGVRCSVVLGVCRADGRRDVVARLVWVNTIWGESVVSYISHVE